MAEGGAAVPLAGPGGDGGGGGGGLGAAVEPGGGGGGLGEAVELEELNDLTVDEFLKYEAGRKGALRAPVATPPALPHHLPDGGRRQAHGDKWQYWYERCPRTGLPTGSGVGQCKCLGIAWADRTP
eukprot:1897053-Pyramimonas_sp.AAC.1